MWEIKFFDDRVRKNLLQWPKGIKAKFARISELIEKLGLDEVGMPHVLNMGQGLYEIRARGPEGIGRAFFCTASGKKIWILHEFIKKTQKTPQRELDIARRRMMELKNG